MLDRRTYDLEFASYWPTLFLCSVFTLEQIYVLAVFMCFVSSRSHERSRVIEDVRKKSQPQISNGNAPGSNKTNLNALSEITVIVNAYEWINVISVYFVIITNL